MQLVDNRKRRTVNSEGINELEIADDKKPRRAQTEICNWIAETHAS